MKPSRWRWLISGMVAAALLTGMGFATLAEMQTSRLQARLLSQLAEWLRFQVEEGPSDQHWPPGRGPYDERLGYASLSRHLLTLEENNYTIEQQARLSPALLRFVQGGGFPVFAEKARAGLTLLDREGQVLYAFRYPERGFASFEEVPPRVVDTLLFIENRELLDSGEPQRNPAVEWDRFFGAALTLPLQWISPGRRIAGGSTLATQIEKFRHSPEGQTHSPVEKLRQMITASVRAYRNGEDTTQARRQIVVDYLNSTPLTARSGYGEVNGLGDGLWVWFGTDLEKAAQALRAPADDARSRQVQALAYKQILALLLAQRRPSHYLIQDRAALGRLTDTYLRLLEEAGVIDAGLRDTALALPLSVRADTPEPLATSFVEQKAANAIRSRLLTLAGVGSLYQLDRMDLTVQSTLDMQTQKAVVDILRHLNEPATIRALGLEGERLLSRGDLSKVTYSVTLFERGADANFVRVQADNLDQPLDINEMAKLDLGSTAKLRTLISYLEVVALLHSRYAHLPARDLATVAGDAHDPLTQWAAQHLSAAADRSLSVTLDAAMLRSYSGNPGEVFFTGGGQHTFENFDKKYNNAQLTLTEALRHSVNLPFIRLMRDIIQFHMAEGVDDRSLLLNQSNNPLREDYLARYADKEGSELLGRFHSLYRNRNPDDVLALLAGRVRPSLHRLAVAFRYARPQAGPEALAGFLRQRLPQTRLDEAEVARLHATCAPERYSLADLGYLAGLHPLELWLVGYLQNHPDASRSQILAASATERQESYAWLFKRGSGGQNTRIRIALEEEAFQKVLESWKRLGYPFDSLVPSLATAIGSSADRPAALADLMGVIVNDGLRQPTLRLSRLHFAANTPYETVVGLGQQPVERVLPTEITRTVRKALQDVVENGTAKRVYGAFTDATGTPIPIGGKTGTGDHRFERYGANGQVLESRAVNRTATFVFFIGERFFGTVTAFVHGEEADRFTFTSALPAQLLKALAPALHPLIDPHGLRTAGNEPATARRF